jgi:hypothetical protein
MFGQDNYENTWKLIQLANQERLEEANRIHMAKLAKQTHSRTVPALTLALTPFTRRVQRTASAILALIAN